jgi:hypothetical protein
MVGWCEYGAELSCSDVFDNDADTFPDCRDPDCDQIGLCELGTELSCSDTVDNDEDTFTDCADPDCDTMEWCEYGTELTCSDGKDNDRDANPDCLDADCDGMICDLDGNACTPDFCSDDACQAALPIDCSDGVACTADTCHLITGCSNDPIPSCTGSVEVASVDPGPDEGAQFFGGPSVPGGIEITFADSTGGTLTVEQILVPLSSVTLLGPPYSLLDLLLYGTDPVYFWNISYTGTFASSTVTFGYDEAAIVSPWGETTVLMLHYTIGGPHMGWGPHIDGWSDPQANTLTIVVTSFSPFALGVPESVAVPALRSWGSLLLAIGVLALTGVAAIRLRGRRPLGGRFLQ